MTGPLHLAPVRLGRWCQGPTGHGQGGWTAQRLVSAIGQPATVAIKAPIPLETDMHVTPGDTQNRDSQHGAEAETWQLVDPEGATILEATRWEPDYPDTAPVSVADASLARERFMFDSAAHPVPACFSCGLEPDSMRVHAGPLGDGRFATDWTVPAWASRSDSNSDSNSDSSASEDSNGDGSVDEGCLWAALDCTAALFVSCDGGIRRSVTAQLAVDVIHPLVPDATYALVAWAGDWPHPSWDGRKRAAASAAFDENGRCVARSRSFWIALD